MNLKGLIAGMCLTVTLVQADVISWRVDIPVGDGGNNYLTAQLFATSQNTGNYWETGTLQGGTASRYDNDVGVTVQDANVAASGYFYVKLFSDAGATTLAGYSLVVAWDALPAGSLAPGSLPSVPTTSYWNAGATGVTLVPEPTSIGLLAIGMSALLLRRRRRV